MAADFAGYVCQSAAVRLKNENLLKSLLHDSGKMPR
jgi:hypothetical protein